MSKICELSWKLFFCNRTCDILTSNMFSTINEYKYNFSSDQIIRITIPPYDFELYASYNACNMSSNSSTIGKIFAKLFIDTFFINLTCVLSYILFPDLSSRIIFPSNLWILKGTQRVPSVPS